MKVSIEDLKKLTGKGYLLDDVVKVLEEKEIQDSNQQEEKLDKVIDDFIEEEVQLKKIRNQ